MPPGTTHLLAPPPAADALRFIEDNGRSTPRWSCVRVLVSGEFTPFTSKGIINSKCGDRSSHKACPYLITGTVPRSFVCS